MSVREPPKALEDSLPNYQIFGENHAASAATRTRFSIIARITY
ncbi:MAG TPA: hypothetical protein VI636_02595 [Candidatus Angelobacter sp.]